MKALRFLWQRPLLQKINGAQALGASLQIVLLRQCAQKNAPVHFTKIADQKTRSHNNYKKFKFDLKSSLKLVKNDFFFISAKWTLAQNAILVHN